jgi:hypothetical protein
VTNHTVTEACWRVNHRPLTLPSPQRGEGYFERCPRGERSFDGYLRGERSFDGYPRGERSFDGYPRGGRKIWALSTRKAGSFT